MREGKVARRRKDSGEEWFKVRWIDDIFFEM